MFTKVQQEKHLTKVFTEITEQERQKRTMAWKQAWEQIQSVNTENNNNNSKDNDLTPYKFANYLLKTFRFIKIHSVLHIYNGKFGYYQPLTPVNGDFLIRTITPSDICDWISSQRIKETIAWLNSLVEEEVLPNTLYYSASRYLNFIDGYFDVIDEKFYSHNPNIIFTSYIPFTYLECCDAKESPVFDDWIEKITNNDPNLRALMAQIFGYLISEYRRLKYIFIFYGPSNAGKSIWLDIIKAAIGNDFVKSISLHNLTTNFRTAELVGMKANIFAEIDQRKIVNIDLIKSLVGGCDTINADVKNARPIEFINTAALVFSTNSLEGLKVADPGNALANRLLIVPFRKAVEEDKIDNNFVNKLLRELPAIIWKFAIPGFGYLALNNFRFTLDAVAQFKNPAQESIDIAVSFLKDACVFDGTGKIHTDRLYPVYVNYCNNNRLPVLQKLKFKELLHNLHYYLDIARLTYCEKFRDKGYNRNGFLGITLKEIHNICNIE